MVNFRHSVKLYGQGSLQSILFAWSPFKLYTWNGNDGKIVLLIWVTESKDNFDTLSFDNFEIEYREKKKLWSHFGRDKRIPSKCPWFAIPHEACRVVHTAIHGHDGNPLPLPQCGDWCFCPTPLIYNKKPNFNIVLAVQRTTPWHCSLW